MHLRENRVTLKKANQERRMESRILFVSGHSEDARRLSRMLRPLPLAVDHVETLQQARSKLDQEDYDAILTEAAVADGEWQDVLRMAREYPRQVAVVVTAPQADGELWADVLSYGAFDLLAQPFYAPEVRRILENACVRRPMVGAAG
jgi:DNA-binding NtrC family response regulator